MNQQTNIWKLKKIRNSIAGQTRHNQDATNER